MNPDRGRSARHKEDEAPGAAGAGVALARGVQVLSLFSAERPEISLAALVGASSVPKATLLGILNTLVGQDLLLRNETDGTYRLGYGWLRLADIRRTQSHIRESALPVMRQIRDRVDETVILSLRIGDRRVHLDYVESTQPVRRIAHPGQEGPLHVGAAGLVLLAVLGDAEVVGYLARQPGLDATAQATIQDQLDRVRRDGFAVVSGTVNPDTAAVSAPIRAYGGTGIAALTISCPRDRFTPTLEKSCAAEVMQGAAILSRALGYG